MKNLGVRHQAWLESLTHVEVSKLNAFEVVGAGPESVLDVAGGWLSDESPEELENTNIGYERFYAATGIADSYSPELATFRDHHLGCLLACEYRGYFCPPSNSTLYAAVQAQDAAWVTRLQCVFLPVAAIAHDGEEYIFSTWHPSRKGTSRTYRVHQDDPLDWGEYPSIAAYLAYREAGNSDSSLSKEQRETIQAAVTAQLQLPRDDIPSHLDPRALEPRTRWIVELMLALNIFDRDKHIPTMATWNDEKELCKSWPHLQAYWLAHHLVFDNGAEVQWLREHLDKEHPALAELEMMAQAFEDEAEPGRFFPLSRINGLRRRCVELGIDAMNPASLERVKEDLAEAQRQRGVMDSFLAEQHKSEDPNVQHLVRTWNMLQQAAGGLGDFEGQLASVIFEDQPEVASTYTTRHYSGETSVFLELFNDMCAVITPQWAPYFEAAYTQAAAVSEEHEDAAPGSLVGWGVALGSFTELYERIQKMPWACGRRRFAELAVVADHLYDSEEEARDFLASEAADFAQEFGGWEHGTMSFALFSLLHHDHPKGAELLEQMFSTGNFNGANWQLSLALVSLCAEKKNSVLAPAMKAAVDGELGRHDDGDRARVLRAYVACAGASARAPLEQMRANIGDVRAECQEAALVAALLDMSPEDQALRDRAVELVKVLVDKQGSMELGAAYSLLRSVHDNGVSGFAMLARRAGESDSGDFKEHMKTWLSENADSFP